MWKTAGMLLVALASGAQLVAGPDDGYVGSKSCARCHSALYERYLKTSMGRSIVPAGATARLAPAGAPVRVSNDGVDYEIENRGGDLYQTESQRDASGRELFRVTHKLEFAVGSGANGIGYAIRRGGYLFEAPLSYYARGKTWDLSPGYEGERLGFNRLMAQGCVVCHSGRARPVAGSDGLYLDPPFEEMAIGCENCHGPGSRHVARPAKGSIVNPARLPARRASEICMNCHEAGDTRVYRDGKTSADIRPGEPLADVVAILKIPPSPADASKDLLEHNFSMALSKCYRSSGARMGCLTCHDPHAAPAAGGAAAFYEKKCLTCHAHKGCSLPAAERLRNGGGCIGCHMPKNDIGFIAHSALTNHRIVRRPGAPLPAEAYKGDSAEAPDLIYLDNAKNRPLSPLMLLQAYGELAQRAPQFSESYLRVLNGPAGDEKSPVALAALGAKALRDGGPAATRQAIDYLSKAIAAGFRSASAFESLATAQSADGRPSDAVETLSRGVELFPWEPRLQKALALQYINTKDYPLAKRTLQRYLESFPEDRLVRDLLAKVGG